MLKKRFSFVIKIFTFPESTCSKDEWALIHSGGSKNGYMFTFILLHSPALTFMPINHNCLVAGCNQTYL